MLDYEVLKVIWWALIGVLLVGFAVTDGFDFGVISLLKVIGKTDTERRVMLNTVGPHWDGNQVWFITAGGAIFAAWPIVYAVSFSGFYWALLLVLFAMFFRPVGFEYRSKIANEKWRTTWDWALTVGGVVPSLVFGVAFGNLLLGVPFHMDDMMRSFYTGSFFALLNPFALLCGVVSLLMIIMQGSNYLQMKTEGELLERSRAVSWYTSLITAVCFALAGIWIYFGIDGFAIKSMPNVADAITPTMKTVAREEGAWFANYAKYPLFALAPIIGFAGLFGTMLFSKMKKGGFAFTSGSLALAGIICTAGFSLFPFLMPSTTHPSHSLTMWDVTSSHLTLNIMFWVALIFVPIVLSYTIWGYYKMYGRVSTEYIEENEVGSY